MRGMTCCEKDQALRLVKIGPTPKIINRLWAFGAVSKAIQESKGRERAARHVMEQLYEVFRQVGMAP